MRLPREQQEQTRIRTSAASNENFSWTFKLLAWLCKVKILILTVYLHLVLIDTLVSFFYCIKTFLRSYFYFYHLPITISIHDIPFTIYQLPFIIYLLPNSIYLIHLPFTTFYLPNTFTFYHLPFATFHLPFTI